MKIKAGQKFILFRYSDIHVKNTMKIHAEIIQRIGYVWYGKIGATPSEKSIIATRSGDSFHCIFHSSKSGSYICTFTEYSQAKPIDGTPEYYNKLDFDFFKMYFKLTSIIALPKTFTTNFALSSTNENISNALSYSMGSMFQAFSTIDQEFN
jgi:hypothetical protein